MPKYVKIDESTSIRVLLLANSHCHRLRTGLNIPLVQKSEANHTFVLFLR